ncbi:pantoate--beta-alanine ligase [Pararhodobacter aggregans]|uniref:pantoate--beta-alanine ligase n=1 Tax=Pararhodobacter aggregans TaxID=404875 RepID=UPI003A9165BE
MQVFTTKAAVRDSVRAWRAEGQSVALVPTMGYLHRGHMALVERAKTQAERVVTSIFVNPLQFGPGEDLATYPRDADRDLAMLRDAGVDGVFLPSVEEVYPSGAQTIVETTELARVLIGKLRPGHFRGVTTVVTKLFNIVQPDTAVFGEKDYQQLCIIRQMVRDLDMPIRIEGVPTVREEDGLALSSRNVRLTPEDRAASVILSQSLFAAQEMAKTGITASRLRAWVAANIGANPRADLQSADIRDAETLATISGPLQRPAVILLAVRFGKVLLIDQRVVTP